MTSGRERAPAKEQDRRCARCDRRLNTKHALSFENELLPRQNHLLVWKTAIVDVEVRIEYGLALRTEVVRLRLQPLAHLLLLGICDQASLQIADNLRILFGNVVLLTWIGGEVE